MTDFILSIIIYILIIWIIYKIITSHIIQNFFGGVRSTIVCDTTLYKRIDKISDAFVNSTRLIPCNTISGNTIVKNHFNNPAIMNSIARDTVEYDHDHSIVVSIREILLGIIDLCEWDEWKASIMYLIPPIVEAVCLCKYRGKILRFVKTLGKGGFNFACLVTNNNDKEVLKIRKHSEESHKALARAVKANIKHFPCIYFGSHMLEHTDETRGFDTTWVLMKPYTTISNQQFVESEEIRGQFAIAVIKLCVGLGNARLVFNDWKLDNMLYDVDAKKFVLGDTDLQIITHDCKDTNRITTTESALAGAYGWLSSNMIMFDKNVQPNYQDKINSFTVMCLCAKYSLAVTGWGKYDMTNIDIDKTCNKIYRGRYNSFIDYFLEVVVFDKTKLFKMDPKQFLSRYDFNAPLRYELLDIPKKYRKAYEPPKPLKQVRYKQLVPNKLVDPLGYYQGEPEEYVSITNTTPADKTEPPKMNMTNRFGKGFVLPPTLKV